MSKPPRQGLGTPALLPQEGVVLLPCEPDQFSSFIASLLGQPQVIRRRVRMTYEVGRDDIINIAALLDQRITRQNEASIVSKAIRVIFDDSSSVTLNSIEDFSTFIELNDVCSTALILQTVYLVKFVGSAIPERQKIDIVFSTQTDKPNYPSPLSVLTSAQPTTSSVLISISHADRSWGADIDNLVKNHLSKFSIKQGFIKEKFLQYRNQIIFALISILGGLGTWFLYSQDKLEKSRILLEMHKYWGKMATNDSILSRLDYIISRPNVTDKSVTITSLIPTVFLLGFILTPFVSSLISENLVRKSYVLITSKSRSVRDAQVSRIERNWLISLFGIVVALALGVGGNILTEVFVRH